MFGLLFFFFSSRRRHTRLTCDWSSDVCSSDLREVPTQSNGFYTIVGLVPAEYDVTARQIGMAAQKAHVRVLIAEVFPLDFKLGRSAVQLEAVTIAAAAGVE